MSESPTASAHVWFTKDGVEFATGDCIWFTASDGGLIVRNLDKERRDKIDEAVQLATDRRYSIVCMYDGGAGMIRLMARTGHVYDGFAHAVRQAYRDLNAMWERA